MGKVRIFICCAVFCLFCQEVSFSETVLLKSGQKVEGRVIEKTDKYIKLDFSGVELVYYNDEIASVIPQKSEKALMVVPRSVDRQATPVLTPTAGLLPLPTEPQKMIPPVSQGVQGVQIPSEYQKIIKSTMGNLQAAKPELPGEKE